MNKTTNVDFKKLRGFVVKALGDAVSYQRIGDEARGAYEATNLLFNTAIAELKNELNGDKPLIIIAHSLGCAVMLNNMYDIRVKNKTSVELSSFENFGTLKHIITFGCNLPLFVMAYTNPKIPTPKGCNWDNYYDEDDILGFPLKPLQGDYDNVIDHQINVGGLFTSWNPGSHTQYWTDNNFTKPVTKHISKIINQNQ
jgi:hypothetical protein